MLIKRFEDLLAWQEARKLRQTIYKASSVQAFVRDLEMQTQTRSAAVSAMTNVAEGFANESKPEFARFLAMAGRSASEVQSLLYAALDEHYITETQYLKTSARACRVRPPINRRATKQPRLKPVLSPKLGTLLCSTAILWPCERGKRRNFQLLSLNSQRPTNRRARFAP
jgi:four helix bundle protein